MPLQLTPDEFRKWAKHYHEQYGFKCMPDTGKDRLFKLEAVNWGDNELVIPKDAAKITTNVLKRPDWLDRVGDLAETYRCCLTGMSVLTSASNVIGLDFDDAKFFHHWRNLYRIDCPTVKSGRGYHCYVRCDQPMRRTLLTNYYDIQGWTFLALPPSWYIPKADTNEGRRGYHWAWKTQIRYKWVREGDIPLVDINELGLVPKWYADETQIDKVFDLRLQPSENNIKLM
jgi:hypothetical protein